MTPGCLVRIVDVENWRGMWVGLPNGEEEWIKAPFLTAVYMGPATSRYWRATSLATPPQSNQEILYGGRLLIVQSNAIKEVQS